MAAHGGDDRYGQTRREKRGRADSVSEDLLPHWTRAMTSADRPEEDQDEHIVRHKRMREQLLAELTTTRLTAFVSLLLISIAFEVFSPPDFGVPSQDRWKAYFVVDSLLMGILLIMEGFSPDAVLLALPVIYAIAGIISEQQAFSGFGSPGVVAFAALFALSEAFVEVKVLDGLLASLLGNPKSLAVAQLRVMIPVAVLSAFFNNGPLVSMVVPVVHGWAQRNGHPPSQLMMPVAFASTLGGTMTIIGSAANLLAQDRARMLQPPIELGFFELTPVAIPLTCVGLTYIVLAAPRLLQNSKRTLQRTAPSQLSLELTSGGDCSQASFDEFVEEDETSSVASYGLDPRKYRMFFVIRSRSPLVGKSSLEVGLPRMADVIELRRRGTSQPGAINLPLCVGDILKISATAEGIAKLRKSFDGLEPAVHREIAMLGAHRRYRRMAEAVVSSDSCLVHGSLAEQQQYLLKKAGSVILAVRRTETQVQAVQEEGGSRLCPGDVLLVEAFTERILPIRDFALVKLVQDSKPPRRGRRQDRLRGTFCLLGFVFVIAMNGLDLAPLAPAVIALDILCCFAKVMDWHEATLAVNGGVMITIAASFGVSAALTNTGAASAMACSLVDVGLRFGHAGVLCMVYAGTVILTNIISNTATCVLMVPIAMRVANQLREEGGDEDGTAVTERSLLLLVIFAANAAFATPLGSACNMLVVEAGNYRFMDFLKFGGLLQVVMMFSTCFVLLYVA